MKEHIIHGEKIFIFECGECGISHGIPEGLFNQAQNNNKQWYCPNGHKIGFTDSDLIRTKKHLQIARDCCFDAENRLELAQGTLRAIKGHNTRLKKKQEIV